jgi:hypothetical protein
MEFVMVLSPYPRANAYDLMMSIED